VIWAASDGKFNTGSASVNQQGSTWSVGPFIGSGSTVSADMHENVSLREFPVSIARGVSVNIGIGFINGSLIIEVPGNSRISTNKSGLIQIGMNMAREKLGVDISDITDVMVRIKN
jgi:hypothetical protein